MSDLLIENLGEVATPLGTTARKGPEQGRVERLADTVVLCRQGEIAFVGSPAELEQAHGPLPETERLS